MSRLTPTQQSEALEIYLADARLPTHWHLDLAAKLEQGGDCEIRLTQAAVVQSLQAFTDSYASMSAAEQKNLIHVLASLCCASGDFDGRVEAFTQLRSVFRTLFDSKRDNEPGVTEVRQLALEVLDRIAANAGANDENTSSAANARIAARAPASGTTFAGTTLDDSMAQLMVPLYKDIRENLSPAHHVQLLAAIAWELSRMTPRNAETWLGILDEIPEKIYSSQADKKVVETIRLDVKNGKTRLADYRTASNAAWAAELASGAAAASSSLSNLIVQQKSRPAVGFFVRHARHHTTAPSVSLFSFTGLIKSSRFTPNHMATAAATKTDE
jgi:hypothetical protein